MYKKLDLTKTEEEDNVSHTHSDIYPCRVSRKVFRLDCQFGAQKSILDLYLNLNLAYLY